MRTSEEYLESLKSMKPNVYMGGEVLSRDKVPGSDILSYTFDHENPPGNEEIFTATSHLTGEKVNRFCHINQSCEDLLAKQEMTRVRSRMSGGCIARCMGIDALNAISVISHLCDQAHNTEYHQRFIEYFKEFQKQDLVGCCAQTDVKGDRSLRPADQADPDLYLRVVEKKKDGIVVRGAKAHNSFAPMADEIIVTPTRFLRDNEKDWAVSFAVPGDADGVKLVVRAAKFRDKLPEVASYASGKGECESLTIFDDVFVPWERVFLCGEQEFGGQLALLFSLFHRHSYTGCKPALSDIIMGTAALAAEYSGIDREDHVRSKLASIITVAELVFGCGIAAAHKSSKAPSGTQVPDIVYCNVARKHAGESLFHEYEVLADIAGGLPATLPYDTEFLSPEVGELVQKYMKRKESVSAKDVYKCYSWISDLSCSSMAGVLQYAGLHGGGSPVMEEIAILGTYDLESKKQAAKWLAGIE